jgi:4-hydroxybenzoate polyprenyltransferase
MRPRSWIRSALVFVPLISSRNFLEPVAVERSVAVFAGFSLLSSAVYLFNDVTDRRADALHPLKRNRPVAAGRVSVRAALALAAVLLAGALAVALSLANGALVALFLGYLVMNIAYSLWLKSLVLVDTLVVAAGFLLRAVAGAAGIRVEVSPWLFIVALFTSLSVALLKRRAEMIAGADQAVTQRAVLGEYSATLLDQLVAIATASANISYALYTFNSPHSRALMFTMPLFIYGMSRYLYLVYQRGYGEAPEEVLLRDRPFQINLLLYAAVSLAILVTTE